MAISEVTKMWVVIPVKRFANAKKRLMSILSTSERESLAQVMLNDGLGGCGSKFSLVSY